MYAHSEARDRLQELIDQDGIYTAEDIEFLRAMTKAVDTLPSECCFVLCVEYGSTYGQAAKEMLRRHRRSASSLEAT
jgi:hypothetical protein